MDDFKDFLLILVITVLLIWCVAALPIGRATMRGELLKDGYHVVDTSDGNRNTPRAGEGRWGIQIWRDGWVAVER